MTTASRLRRTFQYPSDDDSDEPHDLDEEHQEQLIHTLEDSDARSTERYRLVFLLVPALATIFFMVHMFTSLTARGRLLAFLGGSSCGCSIAVLRYLPYKGGGAGIGKGKKAMWRVEAEKGPLERYLLPLNAGLASMMLLVAAASFWRGGGAEKDAWHETIPALVLALTLLANWLLAPVNLEELKSARYELKGA